MGAYWFTLRLSRKNYSDKVEKRKSKPWHKGTDLAVVLTTRCNLHCNYCPMFFYDDKYPKYGESTLAEWKEFFEYFPDWISQIYLTGGETSTVSYIAELTNWLVNRGHHVIIFSNLLKPEAFYNIKKSYRFILYPTFHHTDKRERYEGAYNKLKLNTKFKIVSQEMVDKHTFKFSKHKKLFTPEWFEKFNKLYHVAPDGPKTHQLYLGCVRLYKDGQK